MILEIVTPEAELLNATIDSVLVPGIDGEFQILNNHAPIISLLGKGNIKIYGEFMIKEAYKSKFLQGDDNGKWLAINSGTIEMNDNKAIILVD